ncbi:MAG: choice-of-anchor tandem repeat GloVer-containing protein [Terriglobales bacterium]
MSCKSLAWFVFSFSLLLIASGASALQLETVLYAFRNPVSGANPVSSLVADAKGNLYGTTTSGGNIRGSGYCSMGCGTVFELSPPVPPSTKWTETVLHNFAGEPKDGCNPQSGPIFDSAGNLYGTTRACGSGFNTGTVYELSPPQADGTWTETVVFNFPSDGSYEGGQPAGGLVIDAKGNLYGVTTYGAPSGVNGVIYQLAPPAAKGGTWTQAILYSFQQNAYLPFSGLVADNKGNLYGTTEYGGTGSCDNDTGTGCGTVYRLSRPEKRGGSWVFDILYSFVNHGDGQGYYPVASLAIDSKGALYGTTEIGIKCTGNVFQLVPPSRSHRDWTENILYAFGKQPDGANPGAGVVLDNAGRVYGTTQEGGAHCIDGGCGTVFELTPPSRTGGAWKKKLYSFDGKDGSFPTANLVILGGKIYGTTLYGGGNPNRGTDNGLVFAIKW